MLVIFPTNCTFKLQLANVILQRPFKHAFKLEFHNWTTTEVKLQIEANIDIEVDLSMSFLKPRVPAWLFSTWAQVKKMEAMNHDLEENIKGIRCFDPTIQLVNVVEECLDANVEAPPSSFVHETKKKYI